MAGTGHFITFSNFDAMCRSHLSAQSHLHIFFISDCMFHPYGSKKRFRILVTHAEELATTYTSI